MFLLDTDHITVLQMRTRGEYERLVQRMARFDPSEFFVSIITFHEQMLGWNAFISRARNSADLIRGYAKLRDLFVYFRDANVIPFDEPSAAQYDALRPGKIRVATMDLRIGATALGHGLTVLTRNLVDFQRIPNLRAEDWTSR